MSIVGTAVVGVQGVLGLAELAAGGTKLAGVDSQVEVFDHLGYPQWFRLVTGGLEVTAGLALLASFLLTSEFAVLGSVLALAVLAGALTSHVKVGDQPKEMVPAAALLVMAIVVTWYHAGGLA